MCCVLLALLVAAKLELGGKHSRITFEDDGTAVEQYQRQAGVDIRDGQQLKRVLATSMCPVSRAPGCIVPLLYRVSPPLWFRVEHHDVDAAKEEMKTQDVHDKQAMRELRRAKKLKKKRAQREAALAEESGPVAMLGGFSESDQDGDEDVSEEEQNAYVLLLPTPLSLKAPVSWGQAGEPCMHPSCP